MKLPVWTHFSGVEMLLGRNAHLAAIFLHPVWLSVGYSITSNKSNNIHMKTSVSNCLFLLILIDKLEILEKGFA